MKYPTLQYLSILLSLLLSSLSIVKAEIITDGTVGPAANINGPNFIIGQELGSQVGNNLFHSFKTFDINTHNGINESATFTGSNDISNVISRVTGGEISTINGLLKSEIGNADFYFLNPAGVMFGANAKVDVPAAFHVSTADQLRFDDGSIFSSSNPEKSTLGMSQPEAFGFLNPQPASLLVNGSQLEFTPGSHISFSAKDISMTGAGSKSNSLISQGGEINLTATGDTNGEVSFINQSDISASGNILIENTKLSVAGSPPGTITMQGRSLIVDQDAVITALTEGGMVDQNSGIFITMLEDIIINNNSSINANNSKGWGIGSKISLDAKNISLTNGGRLDSRASGNGQAGGIQVHAHDALKIIGRGDFLSLILTDSGITTIKNTENLTAVGAIKIKASELILSDKGAIVTNTKDYGSIQDEKPDNNHPDAIDIQANQITIDNGGKIASINNGAKDAGDISIKVSENIIIDGVESKITSSTGNGQGSNILINVDGILDMKNAASISIESPAGTLETGRSGNIYVNANQIQLHSGAIFDTSNHKESSATIGDIVLVADETIQFDGSYSDDFSFLIQKSGINSQLYAEGDVGDISITSDQLLLTNGGGINAQNYSINPLSYGADIIINSRYIELKSTSGSDTDGSDLAGWSQITSAATKEDVFFGQPTFGNSGRININATEKILIDGNNNFFGATIRNASDSGIAAGIDISANHLIIKNNGQIFSDTTDGQAGDIRLTLEQLDFYGGIITSSTSGNNSAGNIEIVSNNSINIIPDLNGKIWQSTVAQIDSLSSGTGDGDAGSITIKSPLLHLGNGAQVSTESNNYGDGGEINITGEGGIILQDSRITTSSQTGHGGDINIKTAALVMDSGFIQANTRKGAQGGDIIIDVPNLLTRYAVLPEIGGTEVQSFEAGSGRNIIQAAAPAGNPGTLTLTSPEMDINTTLSPLSSKFINPAQLTKDPCSVATSNKTSSLVSAGRGGVPNEAKDPSVVSFGGDRLDQLLKTQVESPEASYKEKQNSVPHIAMQLSSHGMDKYDCQLTKLGN